MSFEFSATESGFADGLGGASNSAAEEGYHYILFGRQLDSQHPKNSGTYFEHDDQIHGGINIVTRIVVTNSDVTFTLVDSKVIRVIRRQEDLGWEEFLRGIRESFEPGLVQT